ncbi:MAG: hypothetical protein QXT19_05200 [Candidatus Woesearchaeota archaeon]
MTYSGSYSGGGSSSYGIQPTYCKDTNAEGKSSYAGIFSGAGSQSFSYGGSWKTDASLYAHNNATSTLETIAESQTRTRTAYVPGSAKGAYLSGRTPMEYFAADKFLVPGSTARFIGSAKEIEEDVKEAFRLTTGEEMPNDIIVRVLNEKQFRKAHAQHNGIWNESIQGFSINANSNGPSLVFARADQLDRLMLTIGHEIGHVLTPTLKSPHDEEAKAFAFSLAWMNAIRENNIAGIGSNILPNPASNGLHNIAFDFVQRIIKAGTTAWETFLQLAKGMLTITEQPIMIQEE